MKKCEPFKEKNREVIDEDTAKSFEQLHSNILKRLTTIDERTVSKVETFLNNSQYTLLREHIQRLRKDKDQVTYE